VAAVAGGAQVDCETVSRWIVKNSAESENLNWILANTKQCPKCKRPIEKNQGCMHMTCSQCKFEFCWLCQGSWAEHGERTGGFYACNRCVALCLKLLAPPGFATLGARCDGWVKRASLLETWQQVTGSLAVSRPIKLTCCGPR